MPKPLRYTFTAIAACNMCGSATAEHRILGRRLNQSQGRAPNSHRGICTTICRCTDCGLVYSDPQPVPVDIQDHYGVPPETYWKPEYFNVDPRYFQHEIRRARELMPGRSGMRSLDIGAGLGKQMIALAAAGFDAYGLEPSRPFHEKAITQMGIDPQKLKLGMLEDIEYPVEQFDLISFGAVLEHLYDPSASISRALHWLKPEGRIHIEVPSADWLVNRLINAYYRITGTGHVGNLSPMHPPYHLHEFSLASFQKNGMINKYSIAFHEYFVCDTYLPRVLDPVLKPLMRSTNTGMQLSIWLRKDVLDR